MPPRYNSSIPRPVRLSPLSSLYPANWSRFSAGSGVRCELQTIMCFNRVPAMPSKIFAILLMLSFGCAAAYAQSQPAAASAPSRPPVAGGATTPQTSSGDLPSAGTIRTRTDEVNVIFTVTDKHGKFVKDMKQHEFKILDNNLPPKEIKSFEAETNLPLRVGLLID